jgi:hypothetical protein
VSAYFPAGTWYSIWDHSCLTGPLTAELAAPLGEVPVHVRGGAILPRQQAANTSAAVRRSEVELLVALGAAPAVGRQRPYADFDQCGQLVQAAVLLRVPGGQQQEEVGDSHQPASWWHWLGRLMQAPTPSNRGRAQHQHQHTNNPPDPVHQQQGTVQQDQEGLSACGALYLDDGVSLQMGGENTLEAWFAAAASADGLSGGLVVRGQEAPGASAATGPHSGGQGGASAAAERLPGVSQVTLLGVWLGVGSTGGLAVPRGTSTPSQAAGGGLQVTSAVAHVEVDGIALPDELVAYDPARQTLQVVLPETQAWSWRLTWSVEQQQLLHAVA